MNKRPRSPEADIAVEPGSDGFVPGLVIPSFAVGDEQTAGFGFHKCDAERRGLGRQRTGSLLRKNGRG